MIEHQDLSSADLDRHLTGSMLYRLSEDRVIWMAGDHALLYEQWVPSSRISGWEYKRLEQAIQLSGAVEFSCHEAQTFWCDVDETDIERRKEILAAPVKGVCEFRRHASLEEALKQAIEDAGVPRDPLENRARVRAIVDQWRAVAGSQLPRTALAERTVEASRDFQATTEVKVPAVGDWHRAKTLQLLRQWRGLARSGETLVDGPSNGESTEGFGMALDVVLVQIPSGGLD